MAIGQSTMENMVKEHADKTGLITGAAGFIGSHLCGALIAKNWRVTALDFPSTNWWRHKALAINPQRIEINIADPESLANTFNTTFFDCVFHLAALTDVTRDISLMDSVISGNITASNNLLRHFRTRANRIIIAGTCEEYGNGPVPFTEKQREIAVSPYSWSKICVTHLAELYRHVFDVSVMVARPFLTYGPLQTNSMLIPSAIRSALQDEELVMTKGEQTRDFIFVSDIVDGLVLMAETNNWSEHIINLGSGVEVKISEVVQLIYKLCESLSHPHIGELPYRPGETMHFFSDNNRAKKILRWTPRVSLKEGLIQTIKWYRQYLKEGNI